MGLRTARTLLICFYSVLLWAPDVCRGTVLLPANEDIQWDVTSFIQIPPAPGHLADCHCTVIWGPLWANNKWQSPPAEGGLPQHSFRRYSPKKLKTRGQLSASVDCHSSITWFSLPSQRTCDHCLVMNEKLGFVTQLPVSGSHWGNWNRTPQAVSKACTVSEALAVAVRVLTVSQLPLEGSLLSLRSRAQSRTAAQGHAWVRIQQFLHHNPRDY